MKSNDFDDYRLTDKVPEMPQEDENPKSNGRYKETVPVLAFDSGLPANVEAEKVLLGSIMLDKNALKTISTTISEEDFFLDSHRRIVSVMESLWKEGKAIDIVTLSDGLSKRKELETVGGVSFLASLTEGIPRKPVIDDYIRIIADKSIARQIITISSSVIARAADQSESSAQTLQVLEAQLVTLKDRSRLLSRNRNPEPFFVGFRTFTGTAPETIDWTVDGLIQKDGNGLIVGDSGTSKSLLAFDLALHLVAGVAWFHHAIPSRVKVGLVSREDSPGLSQSRLMRLKEGAPESVSMFLDGVDLEEWLYINTRTQRETWSLQKESDVQEIIEASKERGIQFLFFDVFRTLWDGNENDNQETAKVLAVAKRISREAKCQVCIVHHLSKSDRGTIFDRARGGGINGWKEWGLGITVENPDVEPRDQIRKVQFHTKMACASNPIYYRIVGEEKTVKIEEVGEPTQQYTSYNSGKEKKKDSAPKQHKTLYSDTED